MQISLTAAPYQRIPAWLVLRFWRWLGLSRSEVTIHLLDTPIYCSWASRGMTLGLHLPNLGNMGYDFSSGDRTAVIEAHLRKLQKKPNFDYAIIHPPQADASEAAFSTYCDRLRRVPLPLMLENLPTLPMTDFIAFHKRLSTALERPIGVCLDIPHATLAKDDWQAYYRYFHDQIGVIHLSDLKPPEDSHLPFGMGGVLDLGAILKFLRDDGYSGTLNFEILPPGAAGIKALGATWMAACQVNGQPVTTKFKIRWARMAGLAQRLL